MGFETWATYAVNDHLMPRAFVRDVMMFDRLVVPIPPTGDANEWERWHHEGWQPERQARLLEVLGERAVPIQWNSELRRGWRDRFEAGRELREEVGYAFEATRTELTANLPSEVTGIESMAAYDSLDTLVADFGLHSEETWRAGLVTAVIGRRFLTPEPAEYETDEELLGAAVALSSERDFKRRRAAFWQWEQNLVNRGAITDGRSLSAAVEEMQDLVSDEETALRRNNIKLAAEVVFLIGSVMVSMLAPPLTPVAAAGALLSVGKFASDRMLADQRRVTAASLFADARGYFGWR